MARARIILLVGLPGSGKSTYARKQGWPVLSSDDLRHLLLDDVKDQSINAKIFALLRHILRMRMEEGRPVTCIDATSLTPRERRAYVMTARMYDADAEAVYFDVPVATCQARNRVRERVVPTEILEKMAARMKPPTLQEGFAKVTVVDAKGAVRATMPDPAKP